jgi:DNA segregation ATPase FtsK/SpoIIIE-like protein
VQTLAHFGVEATIVGQISGPRVTRYELQLAPGTKVSKVAALKDDLSYALATTEIRILAPIPGKQAVGVEVPNLSPNLVTLGDIFDDLPATASPLASGSARTSPAPRLDRPRAHAAPPDRRHDRLGQVGLHQHAAHVDPLRSTPTRSE